MSRAFGADFIFFAIWGCVGSALKCPSKSFWGARLFFCMLVDIIAKCVAFLSGLRRTPTYSAPQARNFSVLHNENTIFIRGKWSLFGNFCRNFPLSSAEWLAPPPPAALSKTWKWELKVGKSWKWELDSQKAESEKIRFWKWEKKRSVPEHSGCNQLRLAASGGLLEGR